MNAKYLLGVGALALSILNSAGKADVTLNAVQAGWYQSNGIDTSQGGSNYFVGQDNPDLEHRDFFVFDLSGVGAIQGASLQIFNPDTGFFSDSPGGTETLNLFDVNTSASTLAAYGGGVSTFNDFGTGQNYGSRTYSSADNNHSATIALSAAAVADINAALGGKFAIGGALIPLPVGSGHIFGDSDRGAPIAVHLLLTVPEPTAIGVFACIALAMVRRR